MTPKTICWRQKITSVKICVIVLANPITYVVAILGAIFDFDFFVNLSVKLAVDMNYLTPKTIMLDTKFIQYMNVHDATKNDYDLDSNILYFP